MYFSAGRGTIDKLGAKNNLFQKLQLDKGYFFRFELIAQYVFNNAEDKLHYEFRPQFICKCSPICNFKSAITHGNSLIDCVSEKCQCLQINEKPLLTN